MKTKEEIKQWLLENCVNDGGDINLSDLDFSDFDGDIYMTRWRVKRDLVRGQSVVDGDLYQNYNLVSGSLLQGGNSVEGTLIQASNRVGGNLSQGNNNVEGDYRSGNSQVRGEMYILPNSKLLQKITREELAEMGYEHD